MMLITGKQSLSTYLRYTVLTLIVFNILVLLCLPLILKVLYQNPELLVQLDRSVTTVGLDQSLITTYPTDLPPASYPFYLVFLYASGLGTLAILSQGYLILRRIESDQPFDQGQSRSFRWLAIAFFWLALTFLVKIFLYNTLLTLFCCLLFCILGVVCLILADVFLQAWIVKTDSELTI